MRTVWLPLAGPGVSAGAAISVTVAVVALSVAALVTLVVARRSSKGAAGSGEDGEQGDQGASEGHREGDDGGGFTVDLCQDWRGRRSFICTSFSPWPSQLSSDSHLVWVSG